MRFPQVTASTMGQSSPASVRDDAGDGEDGFYRWRKMPGWVPNDPRCRPGGDIPADPHPANVARRAGRAARLAEYSHRRLAGETPEQAQAGMRIAPGTRRDYERVFLGEHPEMRPS